MKLYEATPLQIRWSKSAGTDGIGRQSTITRDRIRGGTSPRVVVQRVVNLSTDSRGGMPEIPPPDIRIGVVR